MLRKSIVPAVLALLLSSSAFAGDGLNERYSAWSHGPSSDPSFFPIGVWLQSPSRAERYKAAGFNMYVGLWKGPTEDQLSALRKAGMPVICTQNDIGLKYIDDPIILAWMHQDEPDNAQSDGSGGYGPPVLPSVIAEDYAAIKAADPSRPVFLNLGQGVAWDNWYGRGVRTNHPEDYPEYIKGTDIVSFDIYPMNHDKAEIKGNIWYIPYGVERLVQWSDNRAIVWNYVECTNIRGGGGPSPEQVRSEVWMSIINGSTGILYFVHRIDPFLEYALLEDSPDMLAMVTAVNKQIQSLAPVLNSPSVIGGVTATSSNEAVPVDFMVKNADGWLYVFAAAMRDGTTRATFKAFNIPDAATVEVIGEERTIDAKNGVFEDDFGSYGVHLYRVKSEDVGVRHGALPQSIELLGNRPNPFNPSTVIGFTMPADSHVQVAVYNALGTQVAVLHDGALPAGRHEAVWNGCDSNGNPAGSGLYLYRIDAPGGSESGKMTLLR